ncbi:MAG: hypothetical protein HON90_16220 [Halobacteriovoraceae bacterium]|jgi:hypothetical protein|nr:hypothetical protein [Halobacteriovoraceae bacterium]
MKFVSFYLFLFTFSFSLFAGEEGGWHSSGGELFKDAHNPWFVKNTNTIKYCFEHDQSSFSANRATVELEISKAFNYWQKEFEKSSVSNAVGTFNLGSQRIEQVSCGVETDIVFKFGYGTLTKKEIVHLVKPEKYIGVTIRKEYDPESLKGQGIIYISSDKGVHRYENPDGNLISFAWKNSKLLLFALIHELGHVYGIPHSGNGVMSQIFLDQLLNKYLVESFLKLPLESFLQPNTSISSCNLERKIKTFVFNLSPNENCIRIDVKKNGDYNLFAVNDKKETRLIGFLKGIYPELWDVNSRPASILQITKKQMVFTPKQTGFRNFMYGPVSLDQGYRGTLMINNSLPRAVYLKVRSNSFAIYGEYKKKTQPLFIMQSPLSILLLKEPIL